MIWAITGTDTDVGKSVTAAAFAAGLLNQERRVAIYKPTQTGVSDVEYGDAQNIAHWLGAPRQLDVFEGVRLQHAMAPVDAAREEGGAVLAAQLPTLQAHLRRIDALARDYDEVILEGAGGLLVELTEAGETIADLALACQATPVVVTRADLGTLNHTALTLEAACTRQLPAGVLLVGSVPVRPSAVQQRNLGNLELLAHKFGWSWCGGLPADLCATVPTGGRIEELWKAGERLLASLASAPCIIPAPTP